MKNILGEALSANWSASSKGYTVPCCSARLGMKHTGDLASYTCNVYLSVCPVYQYFHQTWHNGRQNHLKFLNSWGLGILAGILT